MGRLKGRGLRPRVRTTSGFTSRVSSTDESAQARLQSKAPAWKRWYKTARWQKLRKRIIERDGLFCQQTGERLSGKHPAHNSPVVDHKRPHRGDPDLFWDEGNLQVVSKGYHDSVKQRLEKSGQI